MKNTIISFILPLLLMCSTTDVSAQKKSVSPYLGWNSFDCYGNDITHELTMSNLEAFIERLKPAGYEYFVIDAGWYAEPGKGNRLDEYGRLLPSEHFFPDGFSAIIDYAHRHGVKFGLHMMRGIPREAVQKNLKIKGTGVSARDIADTSDFCAWSSLMYGVDMTRPHAQAYYDSVMELMAEWGVDFIKYDDISHKPDEIKAVAKAIGKSGREIILSISPDAGQMDMTEEVLDAYRMADMVRITRDLWDLQEDIDITFDKWEKMQRYSSLGFWLDLDMLPLGHIRTLYPTTSEEVGLTRGYERQDNFSSAQKRTFITQRALAASPIFMGGALTSSPQYVFELITDTDMLECNQNGICAELIKRISDYGAKFDIWAAEDRDTEDAGWIGIFNRGEYLNKIKVSMEDLGLSPDKGYILYDIWNKRPLPDADEHIFTIDANDVLFIRYKTKPVK